MLAKLSAIFAKIGSFLEATETPRWQSYMVGVVAFGASLFVTILTDHWHVQEDVKTKQISTLSESMAQFQVHAAAFAAIVVEHKVATVSDKQPLLENLNDQYAQLRILEPMVPLDKREVVEDYQQALLRMKTAVDSTNDVMSMGPFWTSASGLLTARNRLNEYLNSSL